MLQQFFSSRKSILLVLAGVVILALLALTWRIISLQKAAPETTLEPVLKISYCGAEPEELCILSFGRDAEENMVVNIFSPNRKFPDFYLKIKRVTGESLYECEKDKEVRTSVFCYGDMVNLQEKMEVSLFSKKNDSVLAMGNFTLNAILISEPVQAGKKDGTTTPESTVDETPTPTLLSKTPTVMNTPTPDASYPNSSYP
jgi:hypothetical protein